jgi:hypothetical protein
VRKGKIPDLVGNKNTALLLIIIYNVSIADKKLIVNE